MKRFFSVLIISLLLMIPAQGFCQVRSSSESCISTTFNATTTTDTCTVFIGNKKKVTLVLNAVMDWTDSNPDLDLDLKVEVSVSEEGTFYDVDNIIDKTGVDSPVSSPISLALSGADTDTTYETQYYLPDGFTAQYLKLTLTATNSDADDTIVAVLLAHYQQ